MDYSSFFRLPKFRVATLLFVYCIAITASLTASYLLRWEFRLPEEVFQQMLMATLWVLPLKLLSLFLAGQFQTLLTFFSFPDAKRLVIAMMGSAAVMFVVLLFVGPNWAPSRGIILTDLTLSVLSLFSIRTAFRLGRERLFQPASEETGTKKVVILGAGETGAALCQEIKNRPGMGMRVLGFCDDDKRKHGTRIHGVPILGSPEDILPKEELEIRRVIFAMPGAPMQRIRHLVKFVNSLQLESEILPSMGQLLEGRVTVSRLRHVELEDLLGRAPVPLDVERIRTILRGRVILVTGAGGSIGSELCRQVAANFPAELVLVERSEAAAFQIQQELLTSFPELSFRTEVADIQSEDRMRALLFKHRPSVVFHAAAHKHVPLMEEQPWEAIKNNAVGTAGFARLCGEAGVAIFVLISTDKAINPTSVMGTTKRLAELAIQELQNSGDFATKFVSVRFGNVLGSSGSVIPTFKNQIAKGGPVTVTHPEVKRYFMTIPEAVGLVIQSVTMAQGGEIFILDMGEQLKIVDVARQLIELSGLVPDRDILIEFVGLRPGEKLYEELSHGQENATPTEHPKIFRLRAGQKQSASVLEEFHSLSSDLMADDAKRALDFLKKLVPEYNTPQH